MLKQVQHDGENLNHKFDFLLNESCRGEEQCRKNNYINNENVAKLTAHSSALKNKSFYEDENTSIFDLNTSDEEREYTNYVLPITKEYEQQQINATYFNNENFEFS